MTCSPASLTHRSRLNCRVGLPGTVPLRNAATELGLLDRCALRLLRILVRADHRNRRVRVADDVLAVLLAAQRLVDLMALAVLIAALAGGGAPAPGLPAPEPRPAPAPVAAAGIFAAAAAGAAGRKATWQAAQGDSAACTTGALARSRAPETLRTEAEDAFGWTLEALSPSGFWPAAFFMASASWPAASLAAPVAESIADLTGSVRLSRASLVGSVVELF